MNTAQPMEHHPAVSDDILLDTGARDPVFEEIYPRLPGFKLGVTHSWTRGQPFDFYRRMREDSPVMWSQIKKPSSGFWSVVRYDDVKHVELNPQIFSSQRGSINMSVLRNDKGKAERLMYAAYNSLINLDADLHRDLRTQQAAFFFPAYIETLKERVGKKIDDLLDNMERQGPVVDFAKLFSIELPMFTLCEMLGVDEEDRADIIKWMHYLELAPQFITHPFRMLLAEPSFPFRFEKILHDMFSYGERVMADRIRNPREDLLTTIANATLGDKPLSQSYLDGSWLLIIFAGNDTTRNSISGGVLAMNEYPGELDKVKAAPRLIPNMVSEIIRWQTPLAHMRRTATESVEMHGQQIAAGDKVVMWYVSGNRDPRVIEQAHQFRIDRPRARQHLAVGYGIHRCMGNRLAEMQLRVLWEEILKRFEFVEVVATPERSYSTFIRGFKRLEVKLHPR